MEAVQLVLEQDVGVLLFRGCNRSSLSGNVLRKYDQQLDKPCVYAAYAT